MDGLMPSYAISLCFYLDSVNIVDDFDTVKIRANLQRMTSKKSNYHHGDLRRSLLQSASLMLRETGIEGLSLRKLADHVGVSRTALYHHFQDKNELLCALAEQGFHHWYQRTRQLVESTESDHREMFRRFFYHYIQDATTTPETYELMFGRAIWKQAQATPTLKDIAYLCFQYQVEITARWQQLGLFPQEETTVRLAQVIWSTMHGLARLVIDGVYADSQHIDDMCDCAIRMLLTPDTKASDK
ncbi:TetR/AcrR family transcriptional regulator [Vibrio rhizosphaerae]|uniref:TetR/AcrR family transcriptional regulator n=1 Tax=Vibrio rhizosphaerae TaxID=398736 RepID=A0ABU4J183_9VIBR|nr:TetR/AcrR family transcriptional regulator [Vibrio rhizosphaerae]MDW6094263.1 TetR/AcrR family transcriptional regulator [Vibrio rhizosphaerae]